MEKAGVCKANRLPQAAFVPAVAVPRLLSLYPREEAEL